MYNFFKVCLENGIQSLNNVCDDQKATEHQMPTSDQSANKSFVNMHSTAMQPAKFLLSPELLNADVKSQHLSLPTFEVNATDNSKSSDSGVAPVPPGCFVIDVDNSDNSRGDIREYQRENSVQNIGSNDHGIGKNGDGYSYGYDNLSNGCNVNVTAGNDNKDSQESSPLAHLPNPKVKPKSYRDYR